MAKMYEDEQDKLRNTISSIITGGLVGLILLIAVWGCFFIVQPGEQALVFNSFSGLKEQVYGEGMHFKIPVIDSAIKMNIRVQKQQEVATSASKDLQDVSTEVAVNFHIDRSQIVDIYRRIGQASVNQDYMQTQIMNPIIQESVKSVTAKYTAEELISQRPLVKKDIDTMIAQRLLSYNIIVDDISITNFKFSEMFTNAIEAKMVADQNAQKEQNNLRVIEFQAQQKVLQAKGESEAIKIVNEQLLKSPQYIDYMTVQKWNGILPLAMGGNTLFNIGGTNTNTESNHSM